MKKSSICVSKTSAIYSLCVALYLCVCMFLTSRIGLSQQSESAADAVRPRTNTLISDLPHATHISEILRVINDPGANAIWFLSVDPVHPSGPGRLERLQLSSNSQRSLFNLPSLSPNVDKSQKTDVTENSGTASSSQPMNILPVHDNKLIPQTVQSQLSQTLTPVIKAGDHVILEQHTATLDSQLAAIALGPARVGAHFDVRLTVGGRRLHATALSQGIAILDQQQELSGFGVSQ